MLNEMCVMTDQIIYWFQEVYHSYSEPCQVFELSQSLQDWFGQSVTRPQWMNLRKAVCPQLWKIGIYSCFLRMERIPKMSVMHHSLQVTTVDVK